jgi:uncharacterized membrane protein
MLSLILAAVFFIAIHLGVAGTGLRARAVAAVGARGYSALFSIASVVGLAWLIIAYRGAPYLPTWGLVLWWRPVMIVLMLPATALVVIGLATPNPTAVAQEARVSDPSRGIVRVTRHPFLTGTALWALLHLIGNGDLASLLLFGALLIVALVGTASIDARRRRTAGAAWERFAAETSIIPFAAIAAGRNRFHPDEIDLPRWGAAVLVYILLLGAHGPVIGISPFP